MWQWALNVVVVYWLFFPCLKQIGGWRNQSALVVSLPTMFTFENLPNSPKNPWKGVTKEKYHRPKSGKSTVIMIWWGKGGSKEPEDILGSVDLFCKKVVISPLFTGTNIGTWKQPPHIRVLGWHHKLVAVFFQYTLKTREREVSIIDIIYHIIDQHSKLQKWG